MTIKKKLGIAIIAIIVLLCVGSLFTFSNGSNDAKKQVEVIVISDAQNKEKIEKTFKYSTDVSTLEELLKENEDLGAVMEDSAYGAFLTEMLGLKNGGDAGPWWVYESTTNKDCIEQGMCPSISELNIQDKDIFTFKYTSEMF